ncbi:MAG: hydrogenase 3 maturation endopeptidase HyCI [Candidatus Bathyarchaeota archaeon]|nr:hydrogenase 3 maturation endopeptidase HyCI [Candidatus Bathyarchaeota archaeon]MDH5419123.1 hydrogenase 3 maturation endopeptidase HyCI [Candidatus Bathyarchaeota archaeon]MDH5622967.1 hydrogenase 3 maturation endopeptidase HyCI [Candidatus Bathyarchaeota archaeon]MDH5635576.1 hydrogenase 3 maturation endopeptidase HyCI [Candidatus Bathyarchaeota archaeon]MDH5702537.1 hydrogenase 3 maturation endopeptidase HyCI [Candidatus Bathyarchaeota archaeon]
MAGSKNKKNGIEVDLKNWLSSAQRVAIAGIGNPLRKDDFVGVEIVRNLQNKVSQSVYLIECETVPESFIEPITEFNPTHILIIDAAMLNLKPGSSKLIEPGQMVKHPAVSTHALPLRIFCEYLAKTTGAEIALLVMQPEDTSFGEGLTSKLRETATTLTNLLSKILP